MFDPDSQSAEQTAPKVTATPAPPDVAAALQLLTYCDGCYLPLPPICVECGEPSYDCVRTPGPFCVAAGADRPQRLLRGVGLDGTAAYL